MSDEQQQASSAPARYVRYGLIALLFFGTALNYLDRQVLGLLKPTMQAEFEWTDSQFSYFGTVFQIATAIALLGVGWFVDRFGVRFAYGLGVALWSLAGMGHAAAASVNQFVVARISLAVAESVNTPAAYKATAMYLPLRERSIAIGVINSASNIGAILAPLSVPYIAYVYGWHAAFLVTGALGFVWLAFWALGTRNLRPLGEMAKTGPDQKGPPWRELLRERRTWAIAGAKLFIDLVWFFVLFWLPGFFQKQFGLGQLELGPPTAVAFTLAAIGSLTSGMLFPLLLRRGMDANGARKASMLFYAVMVLPLPLAMIAPNEWVAALIIGLALFAHQGFSTNVFGMSADIIPARQVGSVLAIGALAGNLSGAAMIAFTGWALDAGLGYSPMFVMCASAYLLALGWIHLMQPRLVVVNDAE